MATLLELRAEFFEVVNISVQHDTDGFFSVGPRRVSACEIDAGQAAESETDTLTKEITFVVRTTMGNGSCHPANRVALHRIPSDEVKLTKKAAHISKAGSQRSEIRSAGN